MAVQEAPQLEETFEEPGVGEAGEATASAPQEATVQAPAKEPSKHSRPYYVLRVNGTEQGAGDTLSMIGSYEASGDKQAVKKAVDEHGVGSYVAVAESAWHEHAVKMKKQPPTFEFS